MALTIYAVVATVVAVVAIIKAVKWKIATRAMVVYCMKNFRIPTFCPYRLGLMGADYCRNDGDCVKCWNQPIEDGEK